MSTLVIVESPTKAKTIRNYLPSGYRVEASMGHIRDLPASSEEVPPEYKEKEWANIAVNVRDNFAPIYVIPKGKKKVVQTLQKAVREATELILATDEDREGESISWHLLETLQPKIPTKRMVFHEITREAIQKALKNCRTIDYNQVHAQETRRILDRLVGYTVSPLLWKKISYGLSAGRVQSVAVRLIVQRERQRRIFCSAKYWDLKATLEQDKHLFEAKLISLDGRKIATSSDFDPLTGKVIVGRSVVVLDEATATELRNRLLPQSWQVAKMEEKPQVRHPAPPFTTSTLQQESNRKLGISAKDTMKIAQSLYEQGYITYMRTDSVHLSDQAIAAARSCVEQMYGANYLSPKPRQYQNKTKNAQEAHEAIRPAGSSFRIPRDTPLTGLELALYDLIWKRTVASQMADARLTQIIATIEVAEAVFRATGKRIDFAGFFRAYVEGSDDPEAALENQEVILPSLKVGDKPECKKLEVIGHETQPPERYSEASLVKTLESEGIGRPSTYASIISTIIDRGYVQMRQKALIPTFTAFAVVTLLEEHFPDLVDTGFTSRMEQTLDEIATGSAQWLPYLQDFYLGEKGLENQVKVRQDQIDPNLAKAIHLENLPVTVKIGKYGPYLEAQREEGMITASIPADLTPADLTTEEIEVIIKQKTEGPQTLGNDPVTGNPIYVLIGTYGPYVQLGEVTESEKRPKRASLPKGVKPEAVTLEQALGLLALPRTLGLHPLTECPVKAGLGQFGPYVLHEQGKDQREYRSLKSEDDVLTISLDRAVELLAQPKRTRGGSTKTPLKELGVHPEDNQAVNIHEGPYGLYIKYGKVNAAIPEGETVESMNLDKAIKALKAKQPAKKTTAKKTTTSKPATKRTTKKKST